MNNLTQFENKKKLAEAAADKFVTLANNGIESNGKFTVALSGGSTPTAMYGVLASEVYKNKIDWGKVFVFWSDERCVPFDDTENNSHNAREQLLNKVAIPKENIFIIPTELSPAEAAKSYAKTIRLFFNDPLPIFDLILLGMGEDGHTASLFPHTTILKERNAIVKEVYVENKKTFRISFTEPLINNARQILFLVAGKEKEAMVNTILHGAYLPENFPAQLVKNANWYVAF